jgi:hypothetical protein
LSAARGLSFRLTSAPFAVGPSGVPPSVEQLRTTCPDVTVGRQGLGVRVRPVEPRYDVFTTDTNWNFTGSKLMTAL